MTRYLIAAGVALALLAGAYLKGRSDGAEKVHIEWQAEKVVMAAAFAEASAETRRVEQARAAAAQEVVDELESKLGTAESSVTGLARRLRLATARRADCPLPGDPATADGDRGSGGIPDRTVALERATDELFAAAARDSTRLTACQLAYERVRTAGD